MTKRDTLKSMLNERNPLSDTPREVVTPVNLYATPAETEKRPQTHKTTNGQVDKPTNGETDKTTKLQTNKNVKYTTHLPQEIIDSIKLYAVKNKKKDYQVILEAISEYFKGRRTL